MAAILLSFCLIPWICIGLARGQETIEFENHIQPILSRHGCNMGSCHGALAGKGGFRLSLLGYDSESDFFNITRQDRGRRIDLKNPAASLIVAKPSGGIEHKGGVRIPADSEDYQILARWIAGGASGPREDVPTLARVEVVPEAVELQRGDEQQLLVRAHYSNGRIEEVTRWVKYTSSDEAVVMVDANGKAKVVGPGEGAISVWFSSQLASTRIRVPFSSSREGTSKPTSDTWIAGEPSIDPHVDAQLKLLGMGASELCSDSEFIRRATLDCTGTLPTEAQVRAFLANESPNKRSEWIDSLLSSPEYVDYWTYRWSDLLMLNSNLLRADGVRSYYQWIRNHVEKNTPWDRFAHEIVTAQGDAVENGATNFYAINQDPESITENVCQAFMGLSIGCAKCHNHPLEKWTNDQYYAMANMFARVRAKGWGGEVRGAGYQRTVVVSDRGDLIQPLRGKPQPPAPLDGEPLDIDATEDRRIALSAWLVSPENPYFTRTIVNRVWAAYFGIGIVNPVDDMRLSNPASNPALLDSLCEELIKHQYDLKQLMRTIMNSRTYQRSSLTTASNLEDKRYFSRYFPRRLMAEVIHDAIAEITAVPTTFDKIAYLGGERTPTPFYTKGTKAIQLFDASVDNDFLKTFGRNQRRITCECERSDEPSIIQVLSLNNGDTLNLKLAAPGGLVERKLTEHGESIEALVESAYLTCLSRYPTPREVEALTKEIQNGAPEERKVVVEDLYWSLMTSREFLFNH